MSLLFQFNYFFLCECFGCLCESAEPAIDFVLAEDLPSLKTSEALEATL